MKINIPVANPQRAQDAFTMIEVIVAMLCAGLMIAGIIQGYSLSARRAEMAAFTQAGESMAMKQMERVMSARWMPDSGVDQVVSSNFPADTDYLCLPVSQTNLINCTNFTTITSFGTNPVLKMIQVDCVWTYNFQAVTSLQTVFTTTVCTIRGPSIGQ